MFTVINVTTINGTNTAFAIRGNLKKAIKWAQNYGRHAADMPVEIRLVDTVKSVHEASRLIETRTPHMGTLVEFK